MATFGKTVDFRNSKVYNLFNGAREGDAMAPKKMGRPVIGLPKGNDIKVRIDDTTHDRLLQYCKEKNITKAEAIRIGIGLLLNKPI